MNLNSLLEGAGVVNGGGGGRKVSDRLTIENVNSNFSYLAISSLFFLFFELLLVHLRASFFLSYLLLSLSLSFFLSLSDF